MMILSRTTSEADIDSHKLRSALDLISSELEVPFLEKRAKSKMHKKTPIEELNAVIQEISTREKELQAAVGIAKMLLDRNDELNAKRRKLFNKKHHYKAQVKHREQDMESLKDQIIVLEGKYEQVKRTLTKAEEDNLSLIAENKRILYEYSMRKEISVIDSSESYENELFELKAQFNEQYEYLKRSKTEVERELRAKDEQLKKSERDKLMVEENNDKLKKESAKLNKRVKELEEYVNELEESKKSLEEKYRELNVSSLKIRAQYEKLSEDLKVYQIPSAPKKPKVRRQISLKDELGSLEEPRFEHLSHHSYTLSRGVSERPNLSIGLTESIAHITAKKQKESNLTKRKDPSEEYFTLVTSIQITQAVKLNSPYMDAICVIPPHELYQKAIKEDIPFHKWHLWVESQLNSAYIQLVYKSDVKSRGSISS